MTDPYKAGLVGTDFIAQKRDVLGTLVLVFRGKLENRGLSLTDSVTRAVLNGDVHELIVTDEAGAKPGNRVGRVAYLGFVEIISGGVISVGDQVTCAGRSVGRIAGYDATHLPNHMNIVLFSPQRTDGTEHGLPIGGEVRIGGVGHGSPERTGMYEAKLEQMGIRLPITPPPAGAYVPAVLVDGFVYTAGQVPFVDGKIEYAGKVGAELTKDEGYEAAKVCALNCLSAIRELIGSLDSIERIVKVNGFVNSAKGFTEQPAVINGASDLLGEVFGEAGRHARAALGVSELPLNAAVELEMIIKTR